MIKEYRCTLCGTRFQLEEDTNPAELRAAITAHCWKHATEGDESAVVAVNYRADYTCISCGKVYRIGPNGDDALMERINEHRKECMTMGLIPAEFITDNERESWNADADAAAA